VKTRDDARRIAKENWETEQESRRMIREEGKPKAQPQSEPPTEIGIDGVPLPPGESKEPQAGPGGVQPPEEPVPRAADVMGWLDDELEREGVAPPPPDEAEPVLGPPPADKPKLEVTRGPAPDLFRRKGQMAELKQAPPPPTLTTYEQIDAMEPGAVFRWRKETALRRKRRQR
jgi:hypothetical protein